MAVGGGERCRKVRWEGRGLKFVAARRREFALQMRYYKIKGAFAYVFILAMPPPTPQSYNAGSSKLGRTFEQLYLRNQQTYKYETSFIALAKEIKIFLPGTYCLFPRNIVYCLIKTSKVKISP
jgi:hypothetical protein